jgi:polyhydroxyalkanoate synthesis regulator phasin
MTEFSRTESTYTDDTIAVMRDTISAQRKAIQAQRELITELQREIANLRARLDGSPLPEGM